MYPLGRPDYGDYDSDNDNVEDDNDEDDDDALQMSQRTWHLLSH